ncbi:hypothetical protein MRGA423_14300 [Mycobacterium tuberculosis RGTB423]|nr:hypothetical protein MRGA423_14300 [Mycobacterium tuberculosis RGTB423]
MTQTLRLTALDEMFITDDIDIVPSVQIEARVSGRFDLDRLAAALRAAVAKHALARARLGRASLTARTLYWEVPDRADHLAVEITDEPVGEVRSRFYARAPELHRSPVFAVAVVRETVGDRLLLNFHHAAFDGMGGLRLLLSLARAYAGEPDEVGGPPIEEARNLKGVAGSRDLFDVLIRARGLAKPAIDRKWAPPGSPRMAARPTGRASCFAPLTIESDEMATAVARRPEGATVNDLAMAALALTILQWNRTHDVPAADSVSVNMPVNFRPTAWSTEGHLELCQLPGDRAAGRRGDRSREGDRHRRRDHRTIEAIRRRRVGRGSARRGKGVAGDAQAPTSAASPLGRRSVRRKRLSVQPGPRRRPRFRGRGRGHH